MAKNSKIPASLSMPLLPMTKQGRRIKEVKGQMKTRKAYDAKQKKRNKMRGR